MNDPHEHSFQSVGHDHIITLNTLSKTVASLVNWNSLIFDKIETKISWLIFMDHDVSSRAGPSTQKLGRYSVGGAVGGLIQWQLVTVSEA